MARQAGVSEGFVHKLYHENVSVHGEQIEKPVKRLVTRNGTTYTQDTANIGRAATAQAVRHLVDGNHPTDPISSIDTPRSRGTLLTEKTATMTQTTATARQAPAALPCAANDNTPWDGRQVLAWPTGARLLRAGRRDDLALLVNYRRLIDLATGTPANDNWRNAEPAPGEPDDRAVEEITLEIDAPMGPNDLLPTIEQLKVAATLVPLERAPVRRAVVERHGPGSTRRELGGLAFVDGARLVEYRTTPDAPWRRLDTKRRRHHRNAPTPSPALVPNPIGDWSLDETVDARLRLRKLVDAMPESSVRLLEVALGSTRAREIGEAFNRRGKAAERFGVRLIDRAIEHLRAAWRPSIATRAL